MTNVVARTCAGGGVGRLHGLVLSLGLVYAGRMRLVLPVVLAAAVASTALAAAPPAPAHPRLATLTIPGDPAFVKVARDVIDVAFSIDPSLAASMGLRDDALRVPSFSPATVKRLLARLAKDKAALAKLPWQTWSIDRQIDWRWVYAQAELFEQQLAVEKLYEHRPAAWLEGVANTLVAFAAEAPDEHTAPRKVWAKVPAMLKEVRAVAHEGLTRRDRETVLRLVPALIEMATQDASPVGKAAARALTAYQADVTKLAPTVEHKIIGADAVAWRFKRAYLLDRTPTELVSDARDVLAKIDAEATALKPRLPASKDPTPVELAAARAMTRESFLALYDGVIAELRAATERSGFVTIPKGVGPLRARETPAAMVPFTGDGGSMSPPPPFGAEIGYWNVENFRADWKDDERLDLYLALTTWKERWMGPYGAHEAFPGHHLQLAITRLNPNPLRSILQDGCLAEGWGLYAEEELWRHGGLGQTPAARAAVLRSYRARASRVVFSVHVESGEWDLQQAADFHDRKDPGKAEVDEEVLRTIQWPTQLVSYFAGRRAIERLRDEVKVKWGASYSDRAFHDALLAEGAIPVALIRAKLLGTAVPAI